MASLHISLMTFFRTHSTRENLLILAVMLISTEVGYCEIGVLGILFDLLQSPYRSRVRVSRQQTADGLHTNM